MNQDGEPESDEYGPADARLKNVPPRLAGRGHHRSAGRRHLVLRVPDVFHDGARFIAAPRHEEEPRRFGGAQEQPEEYNRRDHARGEHPSPVVRTNVVQQIVNAIGHEDSRDDGHLVERAQSPAHGRRGDFGDVHRRDQRHRANGKAADESRGEEARKIPGDGRRDRRQRKQQCNPQQYVSAAVAVAHSAGKGRAERAAEQQRAERDTQPEITELEMPGQERARAADDGDIESEQQAAGRGRAGEEEDVAQVHGGPDLIPWRASSTSRRSRDST